MPITPTYPGVYVQEVPSGVRTITGVATSIAAFIGRAERGPVNEPITINNFGDFERRFGGLWLKSMLGFAVRDFFLNGGGQAIIVRLFNDIADDNQVDCKSKIILPTEASESNDELCLEAANEGSWGDNLCADVDYDTKDPDDPGVFNLTVSEKKDKEILARETFANVSIDPDSPRYLPNVLEQRSLLVRVLKEEGSYVMPDIRPLETTKQEDITSPPTSPPENSTALASGGSDGSTLNHEQFIGDGTEGNKQGLYALEKADLFNLLCIPPYTNTNDVDLDVVTRAAEYCQKRRAMLLVDPPSGWTNKDTAKSQFIDPNDDHIGTRSNYAALYFPRLKQPNPLRENQVEEFVPCGAVAGVFARIDSQRGVWKAPAGQEARLKGVPQLSVPLTDAENGELNQLGINCLRAFPVYGRVVWGSRTLEGADRLASEWKYIPVRRTAMFIEESLYRGLKWAVFEPNDEPLWAQIRLNVGAFMHNLFRQGAFQGQAPKDAYFVKCDSETTTQNDINMGIVNIWVGFAPLRPAEFVILYLQQMAGQIET